MVLVVIVVTAVIAGGLVRWVWKRELKDHNQVYEEIHGHLPPDGEQAFYHDL